MSIFGIMSLCFLIILLLFLREEISLEIINMKSLAILIIIQLIFVFRKIFYIGGLGKLSSLIIILSFLVLITVLFNLINRLIKLRFYNVNVVLIILAFIFLVYTEYFNGIYSFKSISEFQSYNLPLKKYYYLVPYTVTKGRSLNYEGQASVHYLNLFYSTDIKLDSEGNLFYFEPRGTVHWFQFGIPKGQQV